MQRHQKQQRDRAQFARDVKAIRRWERPRQLRLDMWAEAWVKGVDEHLRAECDDPHSEGKGLMARARAAGDRAAERAVLYHGCPGWRRLRALVYSRDRGICRVCKEHVSWEYYELGHLKERMIGGLDTPDNLVVMCNLCNRVRKPIHETKAEALAWCDSGAWEREEVAIIRRAMEQTRAEVGDEAYQAMVGRILGGESWLCKVGLA